MYVNVSSHHFTSLHTTILYVPSYFITRRQYSLPTRGAPSKCARSSLTLIYEHGPRCLCRGEEIHLKDAQRLLCRDEGPRTRWLHGLSTATDFEKANNVSTQTFFQMNVVSVVFSQTELLQAEVATFNTSSRHFRVTSWRKCTHTGVPRWKTSAHSTKKYAALKGRSGYKQLLKFRCHLAPQKHKNRRPDEISTFLCRPFAL